MANILFTNSYKSPFGEILLVADSIGLVGVWFSKEQYFAKYSNIKHQDLELPVFLKVKEWFDIYFTGNMPKIYIPIHFIGTKFQNEVWQLLCDIPYGNTVTYGYIAKKIKEKHGLKQMSAQAVGGAVSSNKIAIIVPCHRVIGINGNLTGYRGGMDKKIALLKLEKAYKENFSIPKKNTLINK